MARLISTLSVLALILTAFFATATPSDAQVPDIPPVLVPDQLVVGSGGAADFLADPTFTITMEDGSTLTLDRCSVDANNKVTAFNCGTDPDGNARRYYWNDSKKKYHAHIEEGFDTREFKFFKNGDGTYDAEVSEGGSTEDGTCEQD